MNKIKTKSKKKTQKKIPRSYEELAEKCCGRINDCDCKDCKEVVFFEQNRTDDQKRKDALDALHGRLSLEDKERAYKWTSIYRTLVNGDDDS